MYNYPKNKFVASFMESPQMNFLTEIVTKDKHRMSVVIGNERILLPVEKDKN